MKWMQAHKRNCRNELKPGDGRNATKGRKLPLNLVNFILYFTQDRKMGYYCDSQLQPINNMNDLLKLNIILCILHGFEGHKY